MAEELALEQFARNRRAVDADQRPAAAPAGFVDGARQQLLTGAALAGDQHGGIGPRDYIDLAQDALELRRIAGAAAVVALSADFFLPIDVFHQIGRARVRENG